ncbi:MAG: pimeloyl-ACP methyl ester carboxylesterase [Cryomorphaceae bacterium]|jgi:pimeloyl-ACP methyl ester carboxylesterase
MSNWTKYVFGEWSWKRPLYSLLSIYLILLLAVIFYADNMIFFPPAAKYSEDLAGFQYLVNRKNKQVASIYKKADKGMPTLLWSHGNAEDISTAESYMNSLHEEGYGILVYDYPGYGLSEGKPTERGCNLNIKASWLHLTETLAIPEDEIFIIGQSVGSGPAVWLAEKYEPAGLVLISPFKSINRIRFGINPFPYDRFPNIKKIANVNCPLLVIHGDKDMVIDQSHGKAVYEKHSGKKTFHNAKGAGHNDIFMDKKVNAALFNFLKM